MMRLRIRLLRPWSHRSTTMHILERGMKMVLNFIINDMFMIKCVINLESVLNSFVIVILQCLSAVY